MRVKSIKIFIVLLTLLFVFGCPTNAIPGEFTANLIMGVGYLQATGKIFVKGNEYRMDIQEGKEEISILVNRRSKKNILIIHSQKTAKEFLNKSFQSQYNNLFEYYNFLFEKNTSSKKGSEVLVGYECKKIEVYEQDRNLATAWVSNKLNWPIKIEIKSSPKKYVTLHNIKEEPVEDTLFQVPKDYSFVPLSEDKEEKNSSKMKPVKLEELGPKKRAVVDKLKEHGIEYTTKEGTMILRGFGASALSRCFPGWYFFLIERDNEGTHASSNISNMKAAVSKDIKKVYIIYNPEADKSLNTGMEMVKEQNIKLNNEKDVKKLGKALLFLYFRGSKLENVESLGENEWAIYKKSSSAYSDGFILKTDTNGEITELKYKTKLKKG
jgi:hypothetical protein